MSGQGASAKIVATSALVLAGLVTTLALTSSAALGRSTSPPASQFLATTTSAASPLPPPGGFKLKASNGYSIFVLGALAHQGRPAGIGVFVIGRHGGAIYSAPATVSETSIQADLGALGKIAVTFHPSDEERTVRSKCGGKPVSFDSGYYEGTIDFHGEQGYTKIEASKARGDLGLLLDILCPGSSGVSGGPFLPGAELDIEANGPRPGPHLNRLGPHLRVIKNRPSTRAHFEAGISERSNGVSIDRYAGLIASAHTFEYDPKVKTATVRPPAPFSGTAHFHRNAKPGNRWTGDLSVDLPGKPGVKLTGGHLRASLAHAHWQWRADMTSGSKTVQQPPDVTQ